MRLPEGGCGQAVQAVRVLVAGVRHADDDAGNEPVAESVSKMDSVSVRTVIAA